MLAGIALMMFIFSFTAYGFTTYDAIRGFTGDVAARPDQAADLQAQYGAMTAYFSGNTGDTYTYEFRSSPIEVTRAQAAGKDRDAVIGIVLDTYANQFYENSLAAGGPGEPGVVISRTGNQVYGIIALISAIAFIAALARAILGFKEVPVAEKLKGTGIALAAASVFAAFIFILVPTLVKAFAWNAIVEGGADDVWTMVEPVALGSLLQNTAIGLVLAVVLFVVGYLLAKKGGPAEKPGVPAGK
ncbi:MAG: hypothetical protein A4E28_03210 [Methanocella sp. PtaU1.Bin125]|nr:MAG: hypothetical protein A4E28_03210 [Methanocella sp. PtaU1.Bin125]